MLSFFRAVIIISGLTTPAFAAQIEAQAKPSHITVFSRGAIIQWEVDLNAEPGRHDLIVSDIPNNIDPDSLRLLADGATVGAVAVQSAEPAPNDTPESQPVKDARKRIQDAQEELSRLKARIASHSAAAEAWQQRADMVRDMMRGDARIAADDLDALAENAGTKITEYLTKAADEKREAELITLQEGALQRKLEKAEAKLAEVLQDQEQSQKLRVTLEQTAPDATLTMTAFTDQAGWSPSYDLDLTRETGDLSMNRFISVWQATGSDWQNVTMTFSTAHPQNQTAPNAVQPYLVSFNDNTLTKSRMASDAPARMEGFMAADEVMTEPVAATAQLTQIGMTVTYDYPTPVKVHSDTDALRLPLDEKKLKLDVLAETAPRFDTTAFIVAEGANDTGEPILAGSSNLYLDGTLVGRGNLPQTAKGDDLHIGFGPIMAMTAELRTPEEQEGEKGFISRENQLLQTETLIVRNLTDEEWPLRIVDRVPVSKQKELQVAWNADPSPSEQEPDGRRGVLYWEAPIKSGETRQVTIETDIRWPEGKSFNR